MGDPDNPVTLASCLEAAGEVINRNVPFTISGEDRETANLLALLLLKTQHLAGDRSSSASVYELKVQAAASTERRGSSEHHDTVQLQLLQRGNMELGLWIWKVEHLGTVAMFLGDVALDAAWLKSAAGSSDANLPASVVEAGQQLERCLESADSPRLHLAGHGSGGAMSQRLFVHLLATGSPVLVDALLSGGLYTFGSPLALTRQELAVLVAVPALEDASAAELLEALLCKARARADEARSGGTTTTLSAVHHFVNGLDLYPRLLGDVYQRHTAILRALATHQPSLRDTLQLQNDSDMSSYKPVGTYHLIVDGEVNSASCSSHAELVNLLLEQPLASLRDGLDDALLCAHAGWQAAGDHNMAAYQTSLVASEQALTPRLFMGGSPDDYQVVYGWAHGQASTQAAGFLQHIPSGTLAYNALAQSRANGTNTGQAAGWTTAKLKAKVVYGLAEGAASEIGSLAAGQVFQTLMGQGGAQVATSSAVAAAGGCTLGGLGACLPIANTVLGVLNLGASVYMANNTRTIKKEVRHMQQDVQQVLDQTKGLASGLGGVLYNQEQQARMMQAGLLHIGTRFSELNHQLGNGLAAMGTQLGAGLLHMDNKLSVLSAGFQLALDDNNRLLQSMMTGVAEVQQEGFAKLHQEVASIGRTLLSLPEAVTRQFLHKQLKVGWPALQKHFTTTMAVLDARPDDRERPDDRAWHLARRLHEKANDVQHLADSLLLEEEDLCLAHGPAGLLRRLPLLEVSAFSRLMLDMAEGVLHDQSGFRENRQQACKLIDAELQRWLSIGSLYSIATSYQEVLLRLVFLRRAMLDPAQTTVLCPNQHPGQQPQQLVSKVAYNVQDLVWDDGLQSVRDLLARSEPVPQEERLPDEIIVNNLQLATAYAVLQGNSSWGTTLPRVSTTRLLSSLGVPVDRQPAVRECLSKSDAASLMLLASAETRTRALATIAQQLPGSALVEAMEADGQLFFQGLNTAEGPSQQVLERNASLTETPPTTGLGDGLKIVLEWQAHPKQLVASAWSYAATGSTAGMLATASRAKSAPIQIWSTADILEHVSNASGAPQPILGPRDASAIATLRCLVWQPQAGSSPGGLLAGGSQEDPNAPNTLELWQLQSGGDWKRHRKFWIKDTLSSCAWSPGGEKLAALTDAGKVLIWEATGGSGGEGYQKLAEAQWSGHRGERGYSLSWSRGGQLLAWGAADGCVHLYGVGTGSLQVLRCDSNAAVTALAWSTSEMHGDRLLVTGGQDGCVRVWDVSHEQQQQAEACQVQCLQHHKAGVQAVAWRPGQQQVVTVGSDGVVVLWDAVRWEVVAEQQLEGRPMAVVWSPAGDLLAVGTWDGRVVALLAS